MNVLALAPTWEKYDVSQETWVVAGLILQKEFPRIDKLFNMDSIEQQNDVKLGRLDPDEFRKKIVECNVPYISSYKDKEIPLSQEYPIKEIVNHFGVPYFSNTVAYMITLAIYLEHKEINLYGVALMGGHEYVLEKGCVEFWVGMAKGMGVNVNIHGETALLEQSTGLYGYHKEFSQL